jgi:hypothetical protein
LIAVGNDVVEFGLSRRPGPAAPGFTWQLGVRDVDAAIAACQQAGLSFEVTQERPCEDWGYRIVTARSPDGMEVLLEEQAPSGWPAPWHAQARAPPLRHRVHACAAPGAAGRR